MALPFRIGVSGDLARFADGFRGDVTKQLRYAGAVALTKSAQDAQAAIVKATPEIFDRPTPSTLRALRVVPATKDKLEASIEIKDFIGKGTPPQSWLSAEILGGERRHKRSENALISAGVMQPDQFWTPGKFAARWLADEYGNLPSGVITTILSRVDALGEQGYKGNVSAATKRRLRKLKMATRRTGTDYFVWRDRDGRARAIMQLIGPGDVEPVLWFTDRTPIYSQRFKFDDLVLAAVQSAFGREMAAAVEMARSTAR